jgi:hypothetical protein
VIALTLDTHPKINSTALTSGNTQSGQFQAGTFPAAQKRVLGGKDLEPIDQVELHPAVSSDLHAPLALKIETRTCGGIGWQDSKHIPKAKLAVVEESVYGLKHPIYETLELLEK